MRFGVVVVGRVTGTHMIADLGVPVPYNVPVTITPEQAYRSKDLWRSLQQKHIFQLDVTPFKPEDAPLSTQDAAQLKTLTLENSELRKKLQAAVEQKGRLEEQLGGLQEQLGTVLETLARIEKAGPVVVRDGVLHPVTEAVGGDVPTYLPDQIVPLDAKTSITADEDTSEGTSVTDAASRLRELRRSKEPGEDLDFG